MPHAGLFVFQGGFKVAEEVEPGNGDLNQATATDNTAAEAVVEPAAEAAVVEAESKPDYAALLEGMPDEELAKHPRINDLVQHERESVRQKAEAETTRRERNARDQAAREYRDQARYADEIAPLLQQAMDSGVVPQEELRTKLNQIVGKSEWAAILNMNDIADKMLGSDPSIPKRITDAQKEDLAMLSANRLTDDQYRHNVLYRLAEAVAEVNLRPVIEKQVRAEFLAAAETRRLQDNAAARAEEKHPARLNGSVSTGVGSPKTQIEAEALYVAGKIGRAAMLQARRSLPYSKD